MTGRQETPISTISRKSVGETIDNHMQLLTGGDGVEP